jgi:molecular chaperone HscB
MAMADHFDRLGLPRRFSLDLEQIEREYLARSRVVHPDYHSGATDAVFSASLDSSAKLNEAYIALRDPIRRGEYLLGLLGGPKPAEEKNLNQAFLMEMMEIREQIEELRISRGSISPIEIELQQRLGSVIDQLESKFARLELNPQLSYSRAELSEIRQILNAARTIQSLQRELDWD